MKITGVMGGGAEVLLKYQVNATVSNIGIPMLAGATTEAGLDLPGTQNAEDMVGINYDTATFVTAQQTDGTSAERTVLVCVNPDAIITCALAGGSTTGTALTKHAVTTATSDGSTVIVSSSFASPQLLYGTVWGYSGANVGQFRKITATSGGTATVAVAFDNGTTTDDFYLRANVHHATLETASVELTSDFLEIDSTVAVATSGAEFNTIDMDLRDASDDDPSTVRLMSNDHALAGRRT